jgi:hypothetical protein
MNYVLERKGSPGPLQRDIIAAETLPRVGETIVMAGTNYKVTEVVHMLADVDHDWSTREVTVRATEIK